MRLDVHTDLSDSSYDFTRVVWPAISKWCRSGRIVPTETIGNAELATNMDILAGIDAWQVVDDLGRMRGIASRIQWDKPWDSFTIRQSRPSGIATELEKRIMALEDADGGWLLPALTVQAYIAPPRRQGNLLSCAMVRTRDLYKYLLSIPRSDWEVRPGPGGVTFVVVWWQALREAGVPLKTTHPVNEDLVARAAWQGVMRGSSDRS